MMPAPKKSPEDFWAEIRKGNFRPVYLFVGEDAYLKEVTIRLIKEKLRSLYREKAVFQSVIASEEEGLELVSAMYKTPLFGGCTLLVVRDFDKVSKTLLTPYLRYMERPNRLNILVLLSEKKDERSLKEDLLSALQKHGELIIFQKPNLGQIVQWIKGLFRRYELNIGDSAAYKLIEMVGDDRYIIESEVTKIALYFKGKESIGEEDLSHYCSYTKVSTTFELVDFFLEKDYQKVLMSLNSLYEVERDMPLKYIGALNRQIHSILVYKEFVANNVPRSKILNSVAQGREFVLKKIESQAKKWTFDDLRLLLRHIRKLDIQIKQGIYPKVALGGLLFFWKYDA